MPVNIGQLFTRNWGIKLAAIFFAVMLYVAVAAQQPLSQRFALRLAVTVPPGRSVRQHPVGVTVTLSGKGSEILKLRSFPRMIRKTIPDTFSGSVWSIHLQPSDVSIPKGTDVQVAEIAPRDLDVLLDSVGKKDVRIVPLVRVEAESGYVLRGLSIVPSVARVVGPEKSLAAVESITTLPTVISSVNGPFFRTVPLDTTPLGVLRVAPRTPRAGRARLRRPQAEDRPGLTSSWGSRPPATSPRPRCSWATGRDARRSSRASSSCRRTCTACSAAWSPSWRAARTSPPSPPSWSGPSRRRASTGAPWTRSPSPKDRGSWARSWSASCTRKRSRTREPGP